jgi:hypothetical protein
MPYLPFPTSEAESSYNTPGEINPGITPGEWATLRGPFQLPSSDYNQAVAELDAREANPRSGIPDDELANLTLERALNDQLSPFNVGLALGARSITEGRAITPRESYIKSGSTVLQRDPLTGALKTVFSEKPKPGLSALEKARLGDIQAQLKAEYAAYAKATEDDQKAAHARTIRGLREQLLAMASEPVAAAQPGSQSFMVDPNSISSGSPGNMQFPQTAQDVSALDMFGRPGTRTPFVFSGAAAPPPVTAPRRRRWNPTTGRFE